MSCNHIDTQMVKTVNARVAPGASGGCGFPVDRAAFNVDNQSVIAQE